MDLSKSEKGTLLSTCAGHPVASCATCRVVYEYTELAYAVNLEEGTADREQPGTLCPMCGNDLAHTIFDHIETCDNFRA